VAYPLDVCARGKSPVLQAKVLRNAQNKEVYD